MKFERALIAAFLLVVPLVVLGLAPDDAFGWLLTLGAGIGLTAFFYLLQRPIQRWGRGRLGREIALGALLQPLVVTGLVSVFMLGSLLLGGATSTAEQLVASPTPVLDSLTQGAQPLALAADLVELGFGGLAAVGIWALTVCGFSIVACFEGKSSSAQMLKNRRANDFW